MFNHDFELERRYHPENFERVVVLNNAQYKNKTIKKHFKSANFRIIKDKKIK